jgi:hypothetical protein
MIGFVIGKKQIITVFAQKMNLSRNKNEFTNSIIEKS